MGEKQTARDIAIHYFLNGIKRGELKEGDKILNERNLSESLGISRIPLREAICTLSTLGILEARQGSGTYVSRDYSNVFSNVIKKYGMFDRAMVDEVFEARILFEADAAGLAAQNRTEEDVEQLYKALDRHEQALLLYESGELSGDSMMRYDNEIHLGIAASTYNNFMLQMIDAIRYVTMEKKFFSGQYTIDKNHFRQSTIIHREIVNAIGDKNMDEAYKKMREHIIQIRSALDLETIRREEDDYVRDNIK